MELKTIEILLIEVGHLSKHYEKMSKVLGENFNIFKILNLQTSEVRLHSSLLAEFLNPNGSHGQGDTFLKLFLNQLDITNFDSTTALVEVEKFTGFLNEEKTTGGRIDILLSDGQKQKIIIENKIYAGDQEKQLLRYHNYDKKAYLCYLTLFGTTPSAESKTEDLSSEKIKVLSYSKDILNWLEQCKKEAVSLPIIRETLSQYINLLKHLTNQTPITSMTNDIKNLILNNPEYADAIELSNQVLNTLINETRSKFEDKFNDLFKKKNILLKNGNQIESYWAEDGDGIFFGYILKNGEENISTSEIGLKYQRIFKEIDRSINVNIHHIAWFTPDPFQPKKKFVHLSKNEIITLGKDEVKLTTLINKLVDQEKKIISVFLDKIKEDLA